MRQEIMGFGDGSGISWTICKQSAACSKQITTPNNNNNNNNNDRLTAFDPGQPG